MSELTMSDFQTRAVSTAVYPNVNGATLYPIYGLINEVGEFLEHVNDHETPQNRDEFTRSLITAAASVGLIAGVVKKAIRDGNSAIDEQTVNATLKHYIRDLQLVTQRMADAVAAVSSKYSLVIPDRRLDPGAFGQKRVAAHKELGDVFWYFVMAAQEYGFDLGDVAQGVLNKLEDRKARGVLQGSGDNR